MKKKIAVFCDGTWQSLRNKAPTNVVKLARCVAPVSAAGDPQLVYYDEGVGVSGGIAPMADKITQLAGGAFGWGLDPKIEHAYQFLVLNFEPEDEIYVFGFSRGAYTARSLTGLIRKCGILTRANFDQIPEAMERYRNPVDPFAPEMIEFRRKFTHVLATGDEDLHDLNVKPAESAVVARSQPTRAELYQYRARAYRLMYAGIWDTVGELGVPRHFDFLNLDREYDFHDTRGSSLIASIRHAVAANEQREFFDLTPYDNIYDLNVKWAQATGWNCSDTQADKYVPTNWRPYQQHWFPGDHASIGGGYMDSSLSDRALSWIAEGAEWAGLAFDDDPLGPLVRARRGALALSGLGVHGSTSLPKGETRARGPQDIEELSDDAWERYSGSAAFRPENLSKFLSGNRPRYSEPKDFPPV